MKHKYQINIVWSEEDECYIASVPELPGCKTDGDTYEEAIKMAEEAIDSYIDSLQERGLPIPTPMAEKEYSGQFRLRISPNLHRDLAMQAHIKGISLNTLVEEKLKSLI